MEKRDDASDNRLETMDVGKGVVGVTEVGGPPVSSGMWFDDSLTCLIV